MENERDLGMYVVFVEELDGASDLALHTARTLEQAFAQIACRCGYSYRFEAETEGWMLVLTDVERLECSPDPIHSTCIKPRDAQHNLMSQAVDGRLKGHIALTSEAYQRARVMRGPQGARVHVSAEL
jgi:hypothetical protein